MATFKSYIAFHYKPEGSDIKNTFTHKTGEPKQRALFALKDAHSPGSVTAVHRLPTPIPMYKNMSCNRLWSSPKMYHFSMELIDVTLNVAYQTH